MNWLLLLSNLAYLSANTFHMFMYFKPRRGQPASMIVGVVLIVAPLLFQADLVHRFHGYQWLLLITGILVYVSLVFRFLVLRGSFSRVALGVIATISLMQLNWLVGAVVFLHWLGYPFDGRTLALLKFTYAGLFFLELPIHFRYVRTALAAILDDVETQKWHQVLPAPLCILVLTHLLLLLAMFDTSSLSICAALVGGVAAIAFYWHFHIMVVERNRSRALGDQIAASGKLLDVYAHYNRELGRKEEAIRMQRHDFRHVLIHLGALLDDGDTAAMGKYIRETLDIDDKTGAHLYCENKTVNAIVAYYFSLAMEKGVECTASLGVPAHLSIPEAELAVVLGNALDNCVKAASPLGGKGRIRVDAKAVKDRMVFKFANNFPPGDRNDGSGLGLASIRMICDSRDGRAEIDERDGEFRLAVNLPL